MGSFEINWLNLPLPTRSVFAALAPNLASKFFTGAPSATIQGGEWPQTGERSYIASLSNEWALISNRIGRAKARSCRSGAASVRERGIRPMGNDHRHPNRDATARHAGVRQEGAEINLRQVNDKYLQPGASRRATSSQHVALESGNSMTGHT